MGQATCYTTRGPECAALIDLASINRAPIGPRSGATGGRARPGGHAVKLFPYGNSTAWKDRIQSRAFYIHPTPEASFVVPAHGDS